jgi:hypothetical protein
MCLFASPDFGAGASALLVLLIFFLVVFMLIGVAGALATRSLYRGTKWSKRVQARPDDPNRAGEYLRILLFGGFVSVLGTCLLPRPICCLYFGRDRADSSEFDVEVGMTQEEVRAKYGRPHKHYESYGGGTEWQYYTDRWGIGISFINVRFNQQGRVEWSSYH